MSLIPSGEDLKTSSTQGDMAEIYLCESHIQENMNDYDSMFKSLKQVLLLELIELSLDVLTLFGLQLRGLPVVIEKCTIQVQDGLLSGTIDLKILGAD